MSGKHKGPEACTYQSLRRRGYNRLWLFDAWLSGSHG